MAGAAWRDGVERGGKHTSRTDLPLTEHGRERAVELREFLAGSEVCGGAAEPDAAGEGDVRDCRASAMWRCVDDGLKEWDYGVYEGRTTREIQAEMPGWSVWKDPIVGGETVEQVGVRADGVIARALAAAGGDGKVALFAHAHILRILAARWIGLEARGGALFALGTGSVSVLGYERETRVVQRWNRGFE